MYIFIIDRNLYHFVFKIPLIWGSFCKTLTVKQVFLLITHAFAKTRLYDRYGGL